MLRGLFKGKILYINIYSDLIEYFIKDWFFLFLVKGFTIW